MKADILEDTVLRSIGEFYRDRTDVITDAITQARDRHRSTLASTESELAAVDAQLAQKQLVVDRYFTNYEDGKMDRELLETRIEKVSVELDLLRRRRDTLQFRLDAVPPQITRDQLATLGRDVTQIIDHGSDPDRKALCDHLIEEVKINITTATVTPVFRIRLDIPGGKSSRA